MTRFINAAALFAAMSVPAAAAQINVAVFDNGALVGSTTSALGNFTLDVSDPNFDVLTITGAGFPDLPRADLSTVALNVTSAAFTGVHNLTVDVFQTGVVGRGPTTSTFTANDLIGDPGPTTESTFIRGTTTALGALVKSVTFPSGTIAGSAGPFFFPTGAFTSDAQQYKIQFTGADQSSNDTIQFSSAVPEPSTWVMLAVGFAALGWTAMRKGRLST